MPIGQQLARPNWEQFMNWFLYSKVALFTGTLVSQTGLNTRDSVPNSVQPRSHSAPRRPILLAGRGLALSTRGRVTPGRRVRRTLYPGKRVLRARYAHQPEHLSNRPNNGIQLVISIRYHPPAPATPPTLSYAILLTYDFVSQAPATACRGQPGPSPSLSAS